MKIFTKGGAKQCLLHHTGIYFEEEKITDKQVDKIDFYLDDCQYNHKDFEKLDYLLFSVAKNICDKYDIPIKSFDKQIEIANSIGIKTKEG